jgi:hypothetical protein
MDTDDNSTTAPQEQTAQASSPPAIDIEQLAELVYRLMQNELRLEKARGAQTNSSRSD